MFGRHPDLVRCCDGEVTAAEARSIETHLASCKRCRQQCDQIAFTGALLRRVPAVHAPDSIWSALSRRLDSPGVRRRFAPHWHFRLAAVVLVAATVGIVLQLSNRSDRPWLVAEDSGPERHQAVGDWVETTASSRARITLGTIGTVDVEPASRVRLGALQTNAYRLALAQGTISARVTAPPRVFIVDTPASTVVDLGCAYSASIDSDGNGAITVTEGWIALEGNGLESLVPAGATAEIHAEIGPGSPVFDDATPWFKRMLRLLEFEGGGNDALSILLNEARPRDTLTLWHLLRRVDPDARRRVYDRIAAFVPPPDGVSRDAILSLDDDALRRWREELAWKW